jgi:putative transposase
MRYPLVPGLAASGIPVAVTCRALGFSKQAFYAWKNNPVSQRDWDEAHLINAAVDIHHDDPAFGYRFIADELASPGITAGENKVPGCVLSSGSGRCSPGNAGCPAGPGHRCTTTWCNATSPRTGPTSCG